MTQKQYMKKMKKNAKYLPSWAKKRNVKADLNAMMFMNGSKFSQNQLFSYSKAVRKLRKNKKTKKQKKIALTNQLQFMNILYNADRQLHKKKKKNSRKCD